jgi:magnesium transporter
MMEDMFDSISRSVSNRISLNDNTRGRHRPPLVVNGGAAGSSSSNPTPHTVNFRESFMKSKHSGLDSDNCGDSLRGMRIRDNDSMDDILPHSTVHGAHNSAHGSSHHYGNGGGGMTSHGERLHRMVVFEIREDGSSEYFTMTLRSLYNTVVRTITENCKEANKEMVKSQARMQRRNLLSAQWHPLDESEKNYVLSGNDQDVNSGRGGGEVEGIAPNGTDDGAGPMVGVDLDSPAITTPRDVPSHFLPTLTSPHDNMPPKQGIAATAAPETLNYEHPERKQHYQHSQEKVLRSNTMTSGDGGGGGGGGGGGDNRATTYRERLGGYLHPRDMRRLVTPFSTSNEPQLIVRRHAILLNFDPLRAIVLKDRLLVLVPDGADSILIALEGRVRGGIVEMTNQVFGSVSDHDSPPPVLLPKSRQNSRTDLKRNAKSSSDKLTDMITVATEGVDSHHDSFGNNEWEDMQMMDWQKLPFELQSVDAILQTVTSILMQDVKKVYHRAERVMGELRGDSHNRAGAVTEYDQERLRLHKDEVNLMDRRVQGFVRAINQVLDEDEDMTLMNLTRLLTHPDRFVQPVSRAVLEEESDEPELILETYLQQALSIMNTLDLLKGQIVTTQEQISMTLDALRNRLLFINTLLSVASLCVTVGSYIGAIFGMNIANPIQEMTNIDGTIDYSYFRMVSIGTSATVFILWVILSYIFYMVTNTPTSFRGKDKKGTTSASMIHCHNY